MNKRLLTAFLLTSPVLCGLPAQATTVVPPANLGQLTLMSESVTFAEAIESWVEGEKIPYTVTRFHRLEAVAGAGTGDVFEVREPGGSLPDRAAAVAGAPRFADGHRYLLFLDRTPDDRWRSKMMAYGLLEEVAGSDLLRPLPEAGTIELQPRQQKVEPVGVYRRDALLAHLREVARGAPWDRQRAAAEPLVQARVESLVNVPASCVFTNHSDGKPIRWFGFENGSRTVAVAATTPGQTGILDGGATAVQQGLAAWTNHADSVIRYNFGGVLVRNVSCTPNTDFDDGAVVFNDPCNDIADLSGCAGTLAFGGAFYDPNTSQQHDTGAWHPISNTFVVVNNGTQCVGETGFREMMTHELGHTLGFGHHNPPNPADATMSSFLKNDGRGASLAVVDRKCSSYDYHTFLDVPLAFWAWRWIEAIENAGVTTGCGNANYCPSAPMTRGDMATFLLKAREGSGYNPPPCVTPMFADVPCSHPLAPWINELVRRGVTAGCGSGNYCPSSAVTRSQMAVFLLSTLQGPGYTPPACPPSPFNDVPANSPFCPWIKDIAARGVTAGCGGGSYCPNNVVNRDQMAIFLAAAFNLPLPPAP